MKILMIIQWCWPEPDFKCIPMAQALQKLGHEVEVLTGFPNYPGGKLYPGYRIRWIQRETIEGVSLIRVPLFPSHNSSSIQRMLNYISFACSASIIGLLAARKADVVYAYNPMGLPALLFKWIKGTPFVYDIQDLWPDSLVSSGMMRVSGLPLRVLEGFFALVYQSAGKIIVLSPGMKRALEKKGVPDNKIKVVFNWCNESALPKAHKIVIERHNDKVFNILYAGNMGKPQALYCVIEAAKRLLKIRPQVRFTFIGRGTELAGLKAKAANLPNVRFLEQVPQNKIANYLLNASVLLVHLKKEPLFSIIIPSKIQFYMAIGKPILAGVEGESADLIQRANCGKIFEPENVSSLISHVMHISEIDPLELIKMGQKGHSFYERELSIHIAALKFESIFEEVLNLPRSGSLY